MNNFRGVINKRKNPMLRILKNQQGASAVVVAVSLVMLICFAAIAVDGFHLIVVKNELQNAADAGALAGAAALYKETLGASVDPLANQEAYDGATANKSEKVAVELYNYDGTANNQCLDPEPPISDETYEDVQRGHWYFANPSGTPSVVESDFECNGSTTAINVANYSTDVLNADPDFINAVKVVTRRSGRALGTPILSFFARIFGYQNFQMSATAIGYIGFASQNILVGAPIAICKESILGYGSDSITCNEGRMFNDNNDTARWTSLEDCDGNTNANKLKTILTQTCDTNTENPYVTTPEISTVEGQDNVAFDDLINCWVGNGANEIVKDGVDDDEDDEYDIQLVSIDKDGDGVPDQPWKMTLPVIICEGDEAKGPTCGPIVSAVEVKIVWMAMKDAIDPVHPPLGKPDEPGAPDYMHYDIPSYDADLDNIVYTSSWPLEKPPYQSPEGIDWNYPSPDQETIHDPSLMTDEPSIYEILTQNLTEQELAKLESNILADHPDWAGSDEFGNPNWTYQKLEALMDYGEVRWASLTKYFNMKDNDGDPAVYLQKTFYFMPNCEITEPTGSTGTDNFGVLAKYPVLVE
jgi:putative Tad-like protein involved in Flp pilus assembly